MDTPPHGCTIADQVWSPTTRGSLPSPGLGGVAARPSGGPRRRTSAQALAGNDVVGGHEHHTRTMSDAHHNRESESDMSRGQSCGDFPCSMGVGGDLRTLALQPPTGMVRKRIAPLPAAAKPEGRLALLL